jgi:hypothetical protein
MRKKTLNLSVPVELHAAFEDACGQYGHAKQKGMVLSAAIVMFLEADPVEQGEYLKQVATAEITDGVDAMLQRARALQSQKVTSREAAHRPRKAAKARGRSRHVTTDLPSLDGAKVKKRRPRTP